MKKTLLVVICLILFSVFVVSAEARLSEGTTVFAEWSSGSWYHGRVAGRCGAGYTILYDDGDSKCCSRAEIVLDVIPNDSQLRHGVKVLALWPGNERYYPGTLGALRGGKYEISYDDGDRGECTISQIRLVELQTDSEIAASPAPTEAVRQKQTAPPVATPARQQQIAQAQAAEPVLRRTLKIWQGGSSWAEIIESGRLWIEGSGIGEIEADGDVYVEGSREGEIESDGDIYVNGSHRGEIEANGKIWWDGSNVGSIESDGRIWMGGYTWGEVEPAGLDYSELRVVAGIIIFFSESFGLNY
ncbi:MAG: hypothetical protein JEY99_12725 [Spirochaetales bacterium]|nr:hypothetical protein [Spirochaetales bacterium]